ncbi:MAG: HD-GYP domain-containing protein [Clostridium sp.]
MMVSILSQIVEFRNGESCSHVLHINTITGMLLERLMQKTDQYHLLWSDRFMITTASALHDIGKIGIDEKILNKPGKLTKEEFEIMKTHTLIGASMLDSLEMFRNEKLVQVAYQICRWHHERYDGKGYPDGLKGEEIPIAAQVVAMADVYDALVSERVYKKAFSHEKAIEMILNGECGVFNPILLGCLVDIQDRLKEELQSGFQKKKNEDLYPVLSEEIKEETEK